MRRDLGDYQTPPGLVAAVLDRLEALGIPHARVLEPTCGRGHFVAGLLGRPGPPAEVRGFEIQDEHLEIARAISGGGSIVDLESADVFAVDLATRPRWESTGPLLVIGNPPWVTSAALGRLGSDNRPARARIDGLSGLDARTGRSNFDLAEAVWHKLLKELAEPDATIALLCKVATARNVLRWASRTARPIASASIHRVDARRWFDASVDACLFVVRLGPVASYQAEVYPGLGAEVPEATIGVVDDLLVADLDSFRRASVAFGRYPRAWRQGVKHDAAAVMELIERNGGWINGRGETVDVEPEHVYPLAKGADLARPLPRPSRGVVVTQHRLGEDTTSLLDRAPRLWAYLKAHADALAARRSKVYEGRQPFAMFGVGDYSFAPHKVAVSGLHKTPRFRAIGPVGGRPVLLDDTSYFLPCDDAHEADRLAARLNGPVARSLLASLCFADAKRPVTKAILQRIDLDRLPTPRRPSLARPFGVD